MSEEKRFDATPTRLARARREGDRVRSQDVAALASVSAAALAGAGLFSTLAGACRAAIVDAALPTHLSAGPYAVIAACALAVGASGLTGAFAATVALGGGLSFVPPSLKWQKLDPLAGLKRMFSREAAVGGAKALLTALAVGLCAAPPLREAFAAQGAGSPERSAVLAAHALEAIFAGAVASAGIFAVADVLLEREKRRRRLRMSFEELRRDRRQNDGDPLLRGRRRQAHRNLVRGSIGRVAEAAFVVANPTHVAVALAYRPPEVPVPRVLVRAADAGALAVKRRARALGVPIVEDVALARSLFAAAGPDEYIPPGAYAAVAAVVAGLLRAGALP